MEDRKLLFDPFITGNPLAKHIDIEQIEADYILISHGPDDHMADALPNSSGATASSGSITIPLLPSGSTAKKRKINSAGPGKN